MGSKKLRIIVFFQIFCCFFSQQRCNLFLQFFRSRKNQCRIGTLCFVPALFCCCSNIEQHIIRRENPIGIPYNFFTVILCFRNRHLKQHSAVDTNTIHEHARTIRCLYVHFSVGTMKNIINGKELLCSGRNYR